MEKNEVQFSNQSTNFPSGYTWTFTPNNVTYLKGTDQNSANPAVEFTSTGQYTVKLTASNSLGSDEEEKVDYITVQPIAYCDAGSDKGLVGIGRVRLGTIDNNSTLPPPPHYSDYTGTNSTELKAGVKYSCTIDYYYPNNVFYNQPYNDLFIWIDYNGNGHFTDPGERIAYRIDNPNSYTFDFTVPGDVSIQATRMRIRLSYNGLENTSPCGNKPYGEVEDYEIVLAEGDAIWMGQNTNWFDTTNWNTGAVPGPSVNVTIPGNPLGGNYPVINAGETATCKNMTLQGGTPSAKITVNGEMNMTASGN
jgi:PKD repeat protein